MVQLVFQFQESSFCFDEKHYSRITSLDDAEELPWLFKIKSEHDTRGALNTYSKEQRFYP